MGYTTTSSERFEPSDYDLFVGMDTDKRSIAMTVINDLGQRTSLKVSSDPHGVLAYINRNFPERRVAFVYEAGPTGFGLHDAITEQGYTCLVASPASVTVVRSRSVKNNRLDSVRLAESLRGGQISGIRVPSEEYRELRELTQLRNMQIDQIRATKCRIKALLLRSSLEYPATPPHSQWSRSTLQELRHLDCSPVIRLKLDILLDGLEHSGKQVHMAQAGMRELLASHEDLAESMRYLTSIPGIGWIIASYALARIGDWRHLRRSEELSGFLGLVPTESSTGDHEERGSITKGGDRRLRCMMIQGAWVAIRKDPELREFYLRVASNHPRNTASRTAIVAVARKLATRMHCVLRERREYTVRSGQQTA
jgi:transposase